MTRQNEDPVKKAAESVTQKAKAAVKKTAAKAKTKVKKEEKPKTVNMDTPSLPLHEDNNPEPAAIPPSASGPSVGEILQKAREKQKLSLKDVSERLNIRLPYLEALEETRYQDLPGDTYAVGFLRSYARLLDLDGEALVTQLKGEINIETRKVTHERLTELPDTQPLPSKAILFTALIALAVIYLFWQSAHEEAEHVMLQPVGQTVVGDEEFTVMQDEEDIAPIPAEEEGAGDAANAQDITAPAEVATMAAATEEAPATTEESSTPPTEETAAAAPEKKEPAKPKRSDKWKTAQIVIDVKSATWIQVKNERGQDVISRVMKPRSRYLLPNQPGLTLSTSNASALNIMLNGRNVGSLGSPGESLSNFSLDPDDLQKFSR